MIRNFLRRWFGLDEPAELHTDWWDEDVSDQSVEDGRVIWAGLTDLQRFNHWGAL